MLQQVLRAGRVDRSLYNELIFDDYATGNAVLIVAAVFALPAAQIEEPGRSGPGANQEQVLLGMEARGADGFTDLDGSRLAFFIAQILDLHPPVLARARKALAIG